MSETTDEFVKRVRASKKPTPWGYLAEALDRLEALQAELDELRQEEREAFMAALMDGLAVFPEGVAKDAIDYVREAHAATLRARSESDD